MNAQTIPVNEAQTISLIPSEVKQLQTRRFTETLNSILTPKYEPKVKFEDNLVTAAKVNTVKPLTNAQINHLCNFADSWNQDITISRSGAGLKIEFNLRTV